MKSTSQGQVPPPILYQYRPPTDRALGNLCRRVLHFSSPAIFNDPHEWSVPPQFVKGTTRKELEDFIGAREYSRLDSHKETLCDVNRRLAKTFDVWRREGCGVACLSENKCNALMWSRYADRNRGFCLAFNSALRFDADAPLIRVCYSDKRPEFDALKIQQAVKKSGKDDSFKELMCRKSTYWEREQEWRFIRKDIRDTGRLSHYEAKALKSIYLGDKVGKSAKRRIHYIAKKKYPGAELWQARLNKSKYRMKLCPINKAATRRIKRQSNFSLLRDFAGVKRHNETGGFLLIRGKR